MSTMPHALFALCFMALLSAPLSTTAHAAAMVAADQGGGYAGTVLEKVSKTWQAPQYSSEHSVRVRIEIDGDGKILACVPVQSSNLALMDKSACAAAHDVAKFPPPPYGLPINVFLTFWTGQPRVGSSASNIPADLPTQSQQTSDAATVAAVALAKAAEARAAEATKGKKTSPESRVVTPTAQSAPDDRAPLVGKAGEAATPDEARYARKVTRAIRESMIIPAELPKGLYTFKMQVHISSTGQITKADITQSSGEVLMDKYALRAIKRLKEDLPPPSNKLQDLHLTFVVQRP